MHKQRFPNNEVCRQLLRQAGAAEEVIAHGIAVAQCALELADRSRVPVNSGLLEAACLLHDIARGRERHENAGAQLLEQAGYPAVAELIAVHNDLPAVSGAEAQLLYLADKLVRGTRRVTLADRFSASRGKCVTPQALAAWQRRYDRAEELWNMYGNGGDGE